MEWFNISEKLPPYKEHVLLKQKEKALYWPKIQYRVGYLNENRVFGRAIYCGSQYFPLENFDFWCEIISPN